MRIGILSIFWRCLSIAEGTIGTETSKFYVRLFFKIYITTPFSNWTGKCMIWSTTIYLQWHFTMFVHDSNEMRKTFLIITNDFVWNMNTNNFEIGNVHFSTYFENENREEKKNWHPSIVSHWNVLRLQCY